MTALDAAERQLRAAYGRYEWIPVWQGMSGATTYRLVGAETLYLKLAAGMVAEAERIEWLSTAGIPGPRVLDAGGTDEVQWLVMTAVPGRAVSDPWPADRRRDVVDAAARQLRALHAVPVRECPFDQTLDVALADARRRKPGSAELLAELDDLRPPAEDLVVCHGDYCTPNIMVDPETLQPTGLIDLGKLGRADRHADLGLMCGSLRNGLNPQYGEEHVERFLTAYGGDVDERLLTYYLRLDWLF
ncbi:MAG TPA: APH(3') family aminoglycoside O-phosphotransferase [Mycobacteriales bacterium]|nr:APH(3') family aminoglycoside O-phosphotransferase [Mycobacteriales bacterium]